MPNIHTEHLFFLKEDLKSTLGPLSNIIIQRLGLSIGESYYKTHKTLEKVDKALVEDGWYKNAVWEKEKVTIFGSGEVFSEHGASECLLLSSILAGIFKEKYNKRIYLKETSCSSEKGNESCVFEISEDSPF